jgi:outer membrane lipoprotein SlyB
MKREFQIALTGALIAAASTLAPPAFARCDNCGSVVNLKKIEKKGEGSGVGAVIGGVAGGVLGHQVGSGRGNTVATVAGAAGGAYVGNEVEKNKKSTTTYQVIVKMDDGATRYFDYANPTSFHVGDKVRIADHDKLVKR